MKTTAEILQNKRDGLENREDEIRWLVDGAVSGQIPNYQIAAWLMAAFIRGLSEAEMMALTHAFVDSGRTLQFHESDPPRVDKHSTGGVGDKTSIVVAPLVASAGLLVPMISGRGLGFTGGTLDKMESIPGYQTSLALDRFQAQIRDIGVGIVSATRELAPGDAVFYKIRDVTETVESQPLIVASILSKKMAENLNALVMDVKTGFGAVMQSPSEAEALARALVATGRRFGLKVVALLSDMSQPLGCAIGNALEVVEAVETLKGRGPQDFRTLCLELSGWMLALTGQVPDFQAGIKRAADLLASGHALESFRAMVLAQGGQVSALDSSHGLLGQPSQSVVRAAGNGNLSTVRADYLGRAARRLGAGRAQASDRVDPQAGILLHAKIGNPVKKGDPLATLYYNRQSSLESALDLANRAFQISSETVEQPKLIHTVVE